MKYFKIEELTKTGTGLSNIPNVEQMQNLIYLGEHILDPLREGLGAQITISSGFRSPEVNKRVGGAVNSQHMAGEAADLKCGNNKSMFEWIKKNINFDQLIWEFGNDNNPQWVHVSIKRNGNNRNEVLKAVTENGKTVYKKF